MKKLTSIGIVALVVATSSFLITKPTYANTGSENFMAIGTHRVWHPSYTNIFKLRQFGEHCMPYGGIIRLLVGDVVVGTETKSCEGIAHRFRRVSYYSEDIGEFRGWMWDFALEVIDPLEGHFPPVGDTEELPILLREEDDLEGALPEVDLEEEDPPGGTLPNSEFGGTLPKVGQ